MDKAKITKAQAQAVDLLKKVHSESSIVRMHVEHPRKWSKDFECVNGMELDLLIRALYNGYEIELTVEEKLLQQYEMHISSDDRKYRGIAIGIRIAAEIVGIKVPDMYA
ncbi:hypothetical protein E4V51_17245 [Paenibacillus sp. 28ISP30-2]|nr:hypothetical protein [Paenibacillus sp. 28ISP30-2]